MRTILLLLLVIFASNLMQGITGFAGTVLAMPFALYLVGYDTAVPVLNLLGLLSGVYVCISAYHDIDFSMLKRILLCMVPGMGIGVLMIRLLADHVKMLPALLGVIVIMLGINGLCHLVTKRKQQSDRFDSLLLWTAGIVHGMYVCGGPLLISYLTRKIKEPGQFRATISAVWIFLNGILLVSEIMQGKWNTAAVQGSLAALPAFLAGMLVGSALQKKMSKRVFMTITYSLLVVSGISLFMK